ncbi:hypothetical protein HNO89_003362 [Sporosarcina luteola]|nr:hypothetical protein [Sporosarcina luteola]
MAEEQKMTVEESEQYGRAIDARNRALEKTQYEKEQKLPSKDELPSPLTEEEIKQRVGEMNYRNMKDAKIMNSINS